MKYKYVLQLEYLGTNYCGWQKQKHQTNSVQEEVEKALSTVFAEEINTICAGRTDAGVHAKQQFVDFTANNHRASHQVLLGVNSHLPNDIRIKDVKIIENLEFSSRFNAKSRLYKYFIHNAPIDSVFVKNRALWAKKALNLTNMREAAAYLIGEHDFSSFRSRDCQAHNPVRNMLLIDFELITEHNVELICINIKANAFLHNMVRKIVGSLLLVGEGKREPVWLKEVLEARDRSLSGNTVAPCGLYLWEVEY